jgi:signal transduction histidine kinase
MAILASLEILRKRLPDDPRFLSLLDNAVQGAKRGTTLTQRMLAFARRQELKHETVELRDLVDGMNALLERSVGPTVNLESHFPREPTYVLTDANQLETALLNLAINARDAMPQGGSLVISVARDKIDTVSARALDWVYPCWMGSRANPAERSRYAVSSARGRRCVSGCLLPWQDRGPTNARTNPRRR